MTDVPRFEADLIARRINPARTSGRAPACTTIVSVFFPCATPTYDDACRIFLLETMASIFL